MSRTVNHTHAIDGWPFDALPNTAVITTRQVIEGRPVLEVHHDPDGDWQFVCGTTSSAEDGRVACLAASWTGTPP